MIKTIFDELFSINVAVAQSDSGLTVLRIDFDCSKMPKSSALATALFATLVEHAKSKNVSASTNSPIGQ